MRRPHFPTIFALIALLAPVATGCSGSQAAASAVDASGLPIWQGAEAELFGDVIEPGAVGLSLETSTPRADRSLRQRAQTADVVARVRVNTVTADAVGDEVIFHVGIQVGTPTLVEARVPDKVFEFSIRSSGRSFPIAKAFDQRLRGMTFIGFIRRYAPVDGGEPEFHFHFAPDTADVVAAVKEAVVLRELHGS